MSDILKYKPVSIPNGQVAQFGMLTQDGNIRLTDIVLTSVGAQEATKRAMEVAAMGGALSMADRDDVLAIVRSFFSGDGTLVNVITSDNTFDGTYFDIYSEFEVYSSLVSKKYEVELIDYQVLGQTLYGDEVNKRVRNPLGLMTYNGTNSTTDPDTDGIPYIEVVWDAITDYHCTDPTYTNQTSCESSYQSSYCRTQESWPDSCSDPLLTTQATCTYTGCSDPQFTNPTDCLATGCDDPVWITEAACVASGNIWTNPSVWTYPSVWTVAGSKPSAPMVCVNKNQRDAGGPEFLEVNFHPGSNSMAMCEQGGLSNANNGGKCAYSSNNDATANWVWYNSNATKEWCMETTQTVSGWNHLYWAWFADDNIATQISNQWYQSAETISAHQNYNLMTSDNPSKWPESHAETTSTSITIQYGDMNSSYGNGTEVGQSTHPWWVTHSMRFQDPVPTQNNWIVTTYECSTATHYTCSDGVTINQSACLAVPATWDGVANSTQAICESNGYTWNTINTPNTATVWGTYDIDMPIESWYYGTNGFPPHGFTNTSSVPLGLYGYNDATTNTFPQIRWYSPQYNVNLSSSSRHLGTPNRYRIYRAPYWKDGTQNTGSDYALGVWKLVGEVPHTTDTGAMYFQDSREELWKVGIRPFHHVYYKVTPVWDNWEWIHGIDVQRWRISPNKWDPAYNSNNSFSTLTAVGYSYCSDNQWTNYTSCINEGWCNGGGQYGNGNSGYNNNPSGCTSTGSGSWNNGQCDGGNYNDGQCWCDGAADWLGQSGCELLGATWRCCSSSSWGNYTYQNAGNTWISNAMDQSWDAKAIIIDDNTSKRSFRIKGWFKAQSTETYSFRVVGDDSIYLWIGTPSQSLAQVEASISTSNWLAAAPGSHPDVSNTGTISLVEGEIYPIILYNGNHYGGHTCHLYWSTPTISETSNGTQWFHRDQPFHTSDGQSNVEGHPSGLVWSWFRT